MSEFLKWYFLISFILSLFCIEYDRLVESVKPEDYSNDALIRVVLTLVCPFLSIYLLLYELKVKCVWSKIIKMLTKEYNNARD